MNVSQEGALIKRYDFSPTVNDAIKISDKEGTSAEGRIVKVRRNKIHVHVTDKSSWDLVQKGLEIPPPP